MPEFAVILRGFAAATGFVLLCSVAPAFAQQGMMPAPLPRPITAPTPKTIDKAPVAKVADMHVDSVKLGYEKGVGPAVGRNITWRGKEYEVTGIEVVGGGPSFSGNSKFAIAPEGKGLMIGLKALDAPMVAALDGQKKG